MSSDLTYEGVWHVQRLGFHLWQHTHTYTHTTWLIFFFFVNLTQATVVWGEGILTEQMTSLDWPVGKPMRHFLD